jgi:hypothetical protein
MYGVGKRQYLLNYQHLYMSWIIHFEPIETITQMLHITLINIYWNTHNNLMFHIYIWMGWWVGQIVLACKL